MGSRKELQREKKRPLELRRERELERQKREGSLQCAAEKGLLEVSGEDLNKIFISSPGVAPIVIVSTIGKDSLVNAGGRDVSHAATLGLELKQS